MLCGCQSNSQNSDTDKETTGTSDTSAEDSTTGTTGDSTEPFEEYAINITAGLLYLYKEPNYEAETVGILEKGAYIVVDETSYSFCGVPLRWAKLKGYDGWIILNYINDEYIGENWNDYPTTTAPNTTVPETSGNTQTPETDTPFKSYKIKVQNNCLSVYSQPKMSSTYWLYDITDHRTITIVDVQDVWLYTDYRTWAKLESGGWVRLDSITDTTNNSNNATNENSYIPNDNIETDALVEGTTTKEPIQLEGVYISNGTGYQYVYGCGNKHTSTVHGIEFIWYDRYESRDKNNTRVYYSLDIISLDVERIVYDSEPYKGQKEWFLNYEVQMSDDIPISLDWNMYDKEGYWIDEILHYSRDYGRGGDNSVKGNKNNIAKGVCQLAMGGHHPIIERASCVELCPHFPK